MKDIRQLKCELRTAGNGKSIVGKIPYGSITDIGGFREVLRPGCFRNSLNDGHKIISLWSHDSSKPLANSTAGTLQLEDRVDGLYVKITPDTKISWGNDALLATARGDLGGLSFGFTVPTKGGEVWLDDLREVHEADLWEISPVSWPAYSESTISVRNNKGNNNMPTIQKRSTGGYFAPNGEQLFTRADISENEELYNDQQRPSGNDFSFDFDNIEVEDQPIYRGRCALGLQMRDIAQLSVPGGDNQEARGRFDSMVKREKVRADKRAAGTGGMVQAVGQDGGLLLQGESSMELISNGFSNSAVLSRAANRDIGTAQYIELIGLDETSRANDSRGGGIRVYSDDELEQILQTKPKLNKVRLEPKRLTGMYFASNEILDNVPVLQQEMSDLFNMEFAFKGQDLAINGSGAGEAMGVMNAAALVTVAKESGQSAATIVFENLATMRARIRMRNRNSMLWIANQDIEPQLFTLSLPVGTGGSVMPVYIPAQNQADGDIAGYLLGTPIVFVEQCETLGTVGDLVLADWSMYYAANKGGVESASSIHLKFDYNQTTFRFITYFDGQPRVSSAITPYKGSNTVSPFVALATRA